MRHALAGLLCLIAGAALPAEPGPRATDVLLAVIAHEIGHAVIREFDHPILGAEEDIADDVAAAFLYLTEPERAAARIDARARQHIKDGSDAAPEMLRSWRRMMRPL